MMQSPVSEAIFHTWMEESGKIFQQLGHADLNSLQYQLNISNGLMASSIAFDAYINDKFHGESTGRQRRDFDLIFGDILTNGSTPTALKDAIAELRAETDRASIMNMAKPRERHVRIRNERSMFEVIEVVYSLTLTPDALNFTGF